MRERAGRCGEEGIRFHILQVAGPAEGIGHLDDGDFGLR
jgi:hypothetical protein